MGTLIIIIVWFLLCLLIGKIGGNRNIGYGWAFFWAFMLSPLIGLLITLLSDVKKVSRAGEFLEAAKRAEARDDLQIALTAYQDALYYLDKDYRKPSDYIVDKKIQVERKIKELKHLLAK